MNGEHQIQIALKGPRGPAELADFVNVTRALRDSLRNACRCIAGTDEIEIDVVDLKLSSAFVRVAPVANEVAAETLWDVVDSLNRTVISLEGGGDPDPRFDYATLRAISGFSSAVKKPTSALSFGGIHLTSAFVSRIQSLLEPSMSAAGSVTGRLEGLSVHGGNVFKLYPPVPKEVVDCVFSKRDLSKVLAAVDKHVTVYGTLRYAKGKSFPVQVEVDSFEVLPEGDKLPTLLNACGSLRSDSSSVDSIRELRNEW